MGRSFGRKVLPETGRKRFTREKWDQLLGHAGAVTDAPAICFSEELIEAYPDAKVVLVERDIEKWYKSYDEAIIKTIWSKLLAAVAPCDPRYVGLLIGMHMRWMKGWLSAYSAVEARLVARDRYREHYASVRRITPKERLLEYKLGSGLGPLCEFLGKPVPEVPFPQINETAATQEMIVLAVRRDLWDIAQRGAIFGAGLAFAGVAVALVYYKK